MAGAYVEASATQPSIVSFKETPLDFTPANMANVFLWIGNGVLTGSPVDTWPDQVGANDFTAAGSARPSVTAAGGNWTKDVATFDGTNDAMTCSAAAADIKFLHGSAGASAGVLFRPTATNGGGLFLLATSGGSSAHTGFEIWYYSDHLVVLIPNGVSGQAPVLVDVAGLVTLNAKHHVFVRHGAGETNEYEVYFDGTLVAHGSYAYTPSSSNATGPLTIGTSALGAYPFTGDIAEVVVTSSYATNAGRDALFTYWDAL